MNQPTCETCRFWVGTQCHRYPPVLLSQKSPHDREPNYVEQHRPYMSAGEWCGEHQPAQRLTP
jgi:hypothetical protein